MTKNPIVWFQYVCWLVQWWMYKHQPYYPMWLRKRLLNRYPSQRWGMYWAVIHNWQRINPKWQLTDDWRPLPWYVGVHAIGPFVKPWQRIASIVAKGTGGRSHRCEFTDKHKGALYGHKNGAFMNALFEQFIANISDESDS